MQRDDATPAVPEPSPEPTPPPPESPPGPEPPPVARPNWLDEHLGLAVLATMAVALVVRLATASGTWLNPDEALHFLIVNQVDLVTAYKMSLTNAHPPLFFVLLYVWRLVGTSELWLRLLSVLAGTAALWPLYKWLRLLLNRSAAIAGTVVFAFLPATVGLSAEVRGYAVLFLWMTAGLYYAELTLAQRRPRDAALFALFLYLAILTHYSALWFTMAMTAYVLARTIAERSGRRFLLSWLLTQAGAVALYALLYVTHLSKLKDSGPAQAATAGWLKGLYFQPGASGALLFPLKSTVELFKYIFASPVAGIVALAIFVCGLVLVAARLGRGVERPRRSAALLLALPFVFACGGAIAGLFPYGGTRHTVFLAIPAVAGVSAAIAALGGRRTWLSLSLGALVAVLLNLAAVPPPQSIARQHQRRGLMTKALLAMRENVAPGDTVLVDYQTSTLLGYYLNAAKAPPYGRRRGQLIEFEYGPYEVLSTAKWDLTREDLPAALDSLRRIYGFRPGRPVWVVDAGWGRPLVDQSAEYGRGIALFQVEVPAPASAEAEGLLAEVAGVIRATYDLPAKTVLWPTMYRSDSTENLVAGLADKVLTYDALYRASARDRAIFDKNLPALAFWLFDDAEAHPRFMRYMDDGENYIAEGYIFTLLAGDQSRGVAVYFIDRSPK